MENNKNKIFAVIAIGVLLLLLIGSTFAYFAAQGGDASQTDVNVLTHTVDSLVFETGDTLSITADQTSFAQGKGNQTDSTFARATLKANSSTNQATDHYYLYLSIDENTFEYTTAEKTAELILTVNKVEGETKTPVTSIKGLNYVTVGSVSGFDVTDYNNLVMIANNYEITSTGTKIDEWEVTLTLVNLDSNQNNNTGKVFNAQLLIQKEELLAGHIIAQHTEDGTNNLYYHDGVGTYTNSDQEAGDYSYRYSGGDYTIAPAYQETYKKITKVALTDTDAIIGRICGTSEILVNNLACKEEIQYYYLTYETAETKTEYSTYKKALEKAIHDGYLLGEQIKNYVCFGSNDDNCPQDNLYRIIGVFGSSVKLIKADYASYELLGVDGDSSNNEVNPSNWPIYTGNLDNKIGMFHWNNKNYDLSNAETGKYNVWSYSELNKTNLNKNFLNNIGSEWADKIKESLWHVGGINAGNGQSSNTKIVYDYEVGKNKLNIFEPYKAKVGLMYLNDYLYARSPKEWSINGATYAYNTDNRDDWMFLGWNEWTISRVDAMNNVFGIMLTGRVFTFPLVSSGPTSSPVRPSFYLKSSVTFAGGSGTPSDPYRIA